jgi:hypothetical protein
MAPRVGRQLLPPLDRQHLLREDAHPLKIGDHDRHEGTLHLLPFSAHRAPMRKALMGRRSPPQTRIIRIRGSPGGRQGLCTAVGPLLVAGYHAEGSDARRSVADQIALAIGKPPALHLVRESLGRMVDRPVTCRGVGRPDRSVVGKNGPVSRMVNKSSTGGELLMQRAAYMSSTIAALSPRSIATSAGQGRRPSGVSRHMVLL